MAISDDYKESMQVHHARPHFKWGESGFRYAGEFVKNLLRKHPEIKSVLDYGAGHGRLGEGICAQFSHLQWTDYDPGIAGISVLPDGVFDLVVSSDVMEHIEPDLLRKTIREQGDRARFFVLMDISCEPTGRAIDTGPFKGHDEHLIVEGGQWWKDVCADVLHDFTLEKFSDRRVNIKGRPAPRTRMIWRRHGSW